MLKYFPKILMRYGSRIDMESIPEFRNIEEMPVEELTQLMRRFEINSVYFAIDGTRRFAMDKLQGDFNFISYHDLMKREFIRSISTLIHHGFTHIVVLLHDSTSFARGREYLENSIKLGVSPLWSDPDYQEFYDRENIQVRFSGFNNLYVEGGYPEVMDQMRILEEKTSKHSSVILSFYSCFLPAQDVVRMTQLASAHSLATLEDQIQFLYGSNFPQLDLSLYFGKPRSKVSPLLIDNQSLHLYMKLPSFYLDSNMLRRAIWYTILNRTSMRDEYKDYKDLKQVFLQGSETEYFWGEGSYLSDIFVESS